MGWDWSPPETEAESNQARVMRAVRQHPEGINLPFLKSACTDLHGYQVRYAVEELEDRGQVSSDVKDGLRWFYPFDEGGMTRALRNVHLRDASHDSNTAPAALYTDFLKTEIPDLLKGAEGPSDVVKTLKWEGKKLVKTYTEMPGWATSRLNDLFMAYLEEVNDHHIIMKRNDAGGFTKEDVVRIGDVVDGEEEPGYALIPAENRFNSQRRRDVMWGRYHSAWALATEGKEYDPEGSPVSIDAEGEGYRNGVFLTLTTDPKKHENNEEATRNISKAFNRLMSWIKRRKGERPAYIKALEWTDDGKPHLHVVLFGVKRLGAQWEISDRWDAYGQGRIVYLYRIVNDGDGDWSWLKDHPERAGKDEGETIDPIKYLSNEFSKQLNDKSSLALHWIHETRFWTCSRELTVYPCVQCGATFHVKRERDAHMAECDLKTALMESDEWTFLGVDVPERIPAEISGDAVVVPIALVMPEDLVDVKGEVEEDQATLDEVL